MGPVARALILLLLIPPSSAQKKDTKPATLPLAGKVFAITKGGDVKRALLARIYVFHSRDADSLELLLNSSEIFDFDQKGACSRYLSLIDEDLGGWVKMKPSIVAYTGKTDETGSFKIASVKPGEYFVIVRGQAGSSDALWMDKVRGGTEAVKISSVIRACPLE